MVVDRDRLDLEQDQDFRRQHEPGARLRFAAKLILIPPAFMFAIFMVITGALYVSFSPPMEKLLGLAMLVVGMAIAGVAIWFALDRPRQWFAPGVNAEPVPGKRSAAQVVRRWLGRR